ncbi:MAG TPA: ferritin-like domain-containing protein [Myxococcales bacterium]|nr:ferritin-like domain-containing protein [Myxococcales bacterium]
MNPAQRAQLGDVWALRCRVEHEAARRFDRLAAAIPEFDPDSPIPPLLRSAADDERRHATLCADLAARYGRAATDRGTDVRVAPAGLLLRDAVLYEMVAACCVTETESVATVTTLLGTRLDPTVEKVLREIARDEVAHGRIGWAHLAREASQRSVAFLSPWIPTMLAGSIDGALLAATGPAENGDAVLAHGVFPPARKREVFVATLQQVVFPGLERFGIEVRPARGWIAEHLRVGAG